MNRRKFFHGAIVPLTVLALFAAIWTAYSASRPKEVPFARHALDLGASETCAFADIDGDGKLDVVSGEYWYQAPSWTPHRFREIQFLNNYIDNFSDLPLDVNGDGRPDIVSCSWFSRKLGWWSNPGKGGGKWKETVIDSGSPVESAMLVDLENSGTARDILPQYGSEDMPLAWYEPRNGSFVKHVVSPKSIMIGGGAGDVNGDGRNDIVTAKGWFEAPPNPRTGDWKWHPDYSFEKDLSFMYVLDINGDGRKDIIATYAHDYGIFWLEQGENNHWITHVIDDSWSQPHGPAMADINGDGRLELIVGKRYMAHNGVDPGEREPIGLYWYEYEKAGSTVQWTRHIIDFGGRVGGGMQVAIADIDGDGDLDLAVGGKSGLFLFENLTKKPAGKR